MRCGGLLKFTCVILQLFSINIDQLFYKANMVTWLPTTRFCFMFTDSKPRSRDNTGQCMQGHQTFTCTNPICFLCLPERTNLSGASFNLELLCLYKKQKRKENVKQAEKIWLQDSAITEKENELRAKKAKLQRLGTKVL